MLQSPPHPPSLSSISHLDWGLGSEHIEVTTAIVDIHHSSTVTIRFIRCTHCKVYRRREREREKKDYSKVYRTRERERGRKIIAKSTGQERGRRKIIAKSTGQERGRRKIITKSTGQERGRRKIITKSTGQERGRRKIMDGQQRGRRRLERGVEGGGFNKAHITHPPRE